MGQQVAMMLANPTVHELMKLDSHYNIIEFPVKKSWVGKAIDEINFRNSYELNIIAIQQAGSVDFTIEFGPDYVLSGGDTLIGVTTDSGMKKLS